MSPKPYLRLGFENLAFINFVSASFKNWRSDFDKNCAKSDITEVKNHTVDSLSLKVVEAQKFRRIYRNNLNIRIVELWMRGSLLYILFRGLVGR